MISSLSERRPSVKTEDAERLICMLSLDIEKGKTLGECLRGLYAKTCGGGQPGEDAIRDSRFLDILDAAGVFVPDLLEAAFYDCFEIRPHAHAHRGA